MSLGRRAAVAGLTTFTMIGLVRASQAADGLKAQYILVLKGERRLFLLKYGAVLRSYPVRLGPNPVGPKIFEDDGRTPEGTYIIDSRKRDSAYYRSLHISYPSAEEKARAAKYGISAGGNIRIHGTPHESRPFLGDWTDGCIAVSNADMEEIWNLVDVGTPIEIRP